MLKSTKELYLQLLECGETWQALSQDNKPIKPESINALNHLLTHILEPLQARFGELKLTYGFCGNPLRLAIQKKSKNRISPKHDQHSAHELNLAGKRICLRDGAACDLSVPNLSSKIVAEWIINNLPFDRLYYYGESRPIHVSYGPEHSREVIFMHEKNGKRHPKRYKTPLPQHFEYN